MTQAFNLSQLANKVNTSGQLDASTGLVNITPVANGGTGKSSNTSGRLLLGAGTSAMTELTGAATNDVVGWNGSAWVSTPAASVGASGDYKMLTYVSPATYVKPATVKAIKVTVVGGGGAGGNSVGTGAPLPTGAGGGGGGGGAAIRYVDAPALPSSPIAITAGAGTNSFAGFASATGGAAGGASSPGVANNGAGGAGGTGSSGTINLSGSSGLPGSFIVPAIGGAAGSSAIFYGGILTGSGTNSPGINNSVIGGGGGGAGPSSTVSTKTGGTAAPGIVIIEEFY